MRQFDFERVLLYLDHAGGGWEGPSSSSSSSLCLQLGCHVRHPMALLDGILPPSALTAALLLGNAVNARDGEGFTPLELLNRMNENDLRRCRKSLARFSSRVVSSHGGWEMMVEEKRVFRTARSSSQRGRSGSFHGLDEDDDGDDEEEDVLDEGRGFGEW
mmetsp:Transcript_54281/g.65452  ORF Transcript_54281/g.65452 Transcript_54281/m.65452 type:complete len:160 (+) Transcript_54281:309-788(+)